ncbi:extracellular catalytic domain type 1 short-chain-length polyhydroxyalkanoate depolymerase [Sphingomonas sp. PB4P5]|uniref:extracellular catalytic domain type 1 short-chain-length polyhydroxyalkanoate depolymerase n=1 Tax=Parasphingomonas puruogangriensis TaxID=3096155 RepID=UPI002FC83314
MPRISETLAALAAARIPPAPRGPARLQPVAPSDSNPGALAAWSYVPADLPPGAPLVVVLHGCTQNAAGYDAGTGWSRLAEQAGFALLFPEQRRGNNMNLCFNWFQSEDIVRRGGEAESIAQLTEQMIVAHGLDRDRVFVTGLSAGGAMTAVMLATYPDLFAGGAIIGGLPYGSAGGVSQAMERMAGRQASDGDVAIVARASEHHAGRQPSVAIWHGTADSTVTVGNLDQLEAQWRGVHGVGAAAAKTVTAPGWKHESWSADGRVVVETWRIAGMGHGVPIDPSGPERLGAIGPYMLAAGIDSTAAIARSWGLIPATVPVVARPAPKPAMTSAPRPARKPIPIARAKPASGIQGVIEDALRAAGLLK